MITKDNLKEVLGLLGFKEKSKDFFEKSYKENAKIQINFKDEKIIYAPIDERFKEGEYPSKQNPSNAFVIHRHTTTNFSSNENFVCLLCIDALLSKGYEPKHIIIEPTFKVGHNQQVYGDILVLNQDYKNLILIENKTAGSEFSKEWKNTEANGGQLFSYYAVNKTPFLCLLCYDFDEANRAIHYQSNIITMQDNQSHLDSLNINLKDKDKKLSFSDPNLSNAKDYYKVWNESYQLSYTSRGLLEADIQSYKIGKEKYNIKDLSVVSYNQIASIYHDFATILRGNAIGNYENTFYILVDLFLCKIVDELNNPNDLQFYYKGLNYDNALDYCDRLLNLYEIGIQKLFKKQVVNIKKDSIDKIFNATKRHKGTLKAEIEKIFTMQKFFNIKKFNFLEVENEEEFYINFRVLLRISNLIQDFYISQSENNQFLGDLFEGFLNRSVHQTEGRFFTPTPITNFIIASLPQFAKDCKVLDFACGAGHFLTEFIAHQKDANLYGIEKNKDLSKVAKTACIFHNPQSRTQIIFQDALDSIKQIYENDFKEESFDLILSNPPYSVKGFLSILQQSNALNKFELVKDIDSKSYEKNNAIECFFIERSKQFLKDGGIFALVLPVSILQKGGIYEKTRQILFQSFQILAITELNKRTFGSTGTQTAIIFAKKVKKLNDISEFLKVQNYNDEALKDEFLQSNFLKNYCEFMNYDYADFKAFMSEHILSDNLQNTESFKSYFDDFNSNKPKRFKKEKLKSSEQEMLFKASSFFDENKELKAQKQDLQKFLKSGEYKEAQSKIFYEKFLNEMKNLESEKMLYFSLIQDNELILIKSPQDKTKDNKSNKANIIKFLGYDWSNRKGDEGIKYQTSKNEDKDLQESDEDSDEEKKEKEVLRNINSIKFIDTPLYNPNDKNDPTKLNYAIKAFIESSFCEDSVISNEVKFPHEVLTHTCKSTQDSTLCHTEPIGEVSHLSSKTSQNTNRDISGVALAQAKLLPSLANMTNLGQYDKPHISRLIQSLNPNDPDSYQIALVDLKNMINFSNVEFNKAISLNCHTERSEVSKNPFENSQFELVRLGEISQIDWGNTDLTKSIYKDNGKYLAYSASGQDGKIDFFENDGEAVILSAIGARCGKCFYAIGKWTAIKNTITIRAIKEKALTKFIFYCVNDEYFWQKSGSAQPFIKLSSARNQKIPLPPLPIQKQIVAECEKVEEQFNTIRMSIEEYQRLIKAILVKCGICEDNITGGGHLSLAA